MKLVKFCYVAIQLKQTNLENRLHILIESPNEGFNDTISRHFVDELKHCNSDVQMDLHLITSSSGFLFVFNIFGCYVIF